MKIQRLHLKAFGPFTDTELPLSVDAGTVNVLYGPNEAGKSTALRALEGLCFGIDEKSQDGHLHGNDQIRVGASFLLADGKQATLYRKKGRKNTVRNADDAILPEDSFEKILCGVGKAGFEALFCLSYQRLIDGGMGILEENGEIGRLLFEARSDISLQSVLVSLTKQAEDLFKGTPRANAVIDKALLEYDQQRKILKKGDLGEYKTVEGNLTRLKDAKEVLEKDRSDLEREFSRLNQCVSAHPHVTRLLTARQLLVSLGELPTLSATFETEYRDALIARDAALRTKQAAGASVQNLERQLAEIIVDENLLLWKAQIERLNQDVGQINKHLNDLPSEQNKATLGMEAAQTELNTVRPGEKPDEANLSLGLSAGRITNLGREYSTHVDALQNAKKIREECKHRLEIAREELANTSAIRISHALGQALESAQSIATAPTILAEKILSQRDLLAKCQSEGLRLGADQRTLLEFVSLPLPTRAVIEQAREAFDRLDNRIDGILQQRQSALDSQDDLLTRRSTLLLTGEVPTEAQLVDARRTRSQQWNVIRQQVTAPEPIRIEPAQADSFEASLEATDNLSDRLRREADRAASLASIESSFQQQTRNLESLDTQLERARSERSQLEEDWNIRWTRHSIAPESPSVMLDWIERFEALCKQIEKLNDLELEIEVITGQVENATEALRKALGNVGADSSLTSLIAEAKALQSEAYRAKGSIDQLNGQIREDERKLKETESHIHEKELNLLQWQRQWETEVACLGLARIPTVEEADQALGAIQRASRQLDIVRIAERRVNGMQTDIHNFDTAVKSLALAVAPDLQDLPPLAAIDQIYRKLDQAEKAANKQSFLRSNLDDQQEAFTNSSGELDQAEARLKELRLQAGCEDLDELDRVVGRDAKAKEYTRAVTEATEFLTSLTMGKPIEALIAEVEVLDLTIAKSQLDDLAEERKRINGEIGDIDQEIGKETRNLAALDNSPALADAREKAEAALSRIRSSIRPYLVFATAESLLRAQIEEYRRANQGPILKKASEIFGALTDESFTELTADVDDKDERVLVAIRTSKKTGGEERLKVEALSAATRVGLYLALRLACIYHHVDQREGLPFVADDILLDFDDTRARRVMGELGKLAERTQVILFTHHQHLVQIGSEVLGNRCALQPLVR